MRKRAQELSGYEKVNKPNIDTDRLADLTNVRNIMLGTYLRSH